MWNFSPERNNCIAFTLASGYRYCWVNFKKYSFLFWTFVIFFLWLYQEFEWRTWPINSDQMFWNITITTTTATWRYQWNCSLFYLFLIFSAGEGTPGLTRARQVLCHSTTSPALALWDRGLTMQLLLVMSLYVVQDDLELMTFFSLFLGCWNY